MSVLSYVLIGVVLLLLAVTSLGWVAVSATVLGVVELIAAVVILLEALTGSLVARVNRS